MNLFELIGLLVKDYCPVMQIVVRSLHPQNRTLVNGNFAYFQILYCIWRPRIFFPKICNSQGRFLNVARFFKLNSKLNNGIKNLLFEALFELN